ncbi:uncharacterized protein G2W53_014064 [Senna tora]|uniref:Uncharacterized protein n=1 Tax=Senna tora TaxID=362788 RepID=A0A834U2Z7_9FABA|nr:uncharacterized protein G2W53_014064 [Senna tora]
MLTRAVASCKYCGVFGHLLIECLAQYRELPSSYQQWEEHYRMGKGEQEKENSPAEEVTVAIKGENVPASEKATEETYTEEPSPDHDRPAITCSCTIGCLCADYCLDAAVDAEKKSTRKSKLG